MGNYFGSAKHEVTTECQDRELQDCDIQPIISDLNALAIDSEDNLISEKLAESAVNKDPNELESQLDPLATDGLTSDEYFTRSLTQYLLDEILPEIVDNSKGQLPMMWTLNKYRQYLSAGIHHDFPEPYVIVEGFGINSKYKFLETRKGQRLFIKMLHIYSHQIGLYIRYKDTDEDTQNVVNSDLFHTLVGCDLQFLRDERKLLIERMITWLVFLYYCDLNGQENQSKSFD